MRPRSQGGETEELFRKFQGILNKLTPQKFQNLAEQALQLKIDDEERLKGCIDKIFTKVREGDRERELGGGGKGREGERATERFGAGRGEGKEGETDGGEVS